MAKPKTKITIREVAELAGVSAMTVSRVLRNEIFVAQRTRDAVQAAITTLNYEPQQSARSLSSTVAKVIGLVVPHIAEEISHRAGYEYLSALHLGALQVCNARDYGLMLLQVDDVESVNRLVRRANARNVSGYVVAAPATEISGLCDALLQQGIVHSSINPFDASSSPHWVTAGEREATCDLTLELIAHGHRDIAYIGGDVEVRASRERLAGYRGALRKHKIPFTKEWALPVGMEFEHGFAAGRRLLSESPSPTAIQCMTDDLAAGVYAAAHELGLRIPQDVSVVGFDDFGLARKVCPPLTTAHLPVEEMSAHATSQVIDDIEGKAVVNRSFFCPIQMRQSVAAPAATRAQRR